MIPVESLLWIISLNTIVNLMHNYEPLKEGRYDGKNSIDTRYNKWDAWCIWFENGEMFVEIAKPEN